MTLSELAIDYYPLTLAARHSRQESAFFRSRLLLFSAQILDSIVSFCQKSIFKSICWTVPECILLPLGRLPTTWWSPSVLRKQVMDKSMNFEFDGLPINENFFPAKVGVSKNSLFIVFELDKPWMIKTASNINLFILEESSGFCQDNWKGLFKGKGWGGLQVG